MIGVTPGDATVVARRKPTDKEMSDLRGLRRGVYAKQKIAAGERITADNVYFAIPNVDDQLLANDMSKYLEVVAKEPLEPNQPLLAATVETTHVPQPVRDILKRPRELLIASPPPLPTRPALDPPHPTRP